MLYKSQVKALQYLKKHGPIVVSKFDFEAKDLLEKNLIKKEIHYDKKTDIPISKYQITDKGLDALTAHRNELIISLITLISTVVTLILTILELLIE